MDERRIKLLLVLHKLQVKNKGKSIQEVIYLTQEAGIALGYFFCWYWPCGTYCRELNEDLDNSTLSVTAPSCKTNWTMDDRSVANIEKVKELIRSVPDSLPSEVARGDEWPEVLAGTHFLISRKQVTGKDEIKKIQRALPRSYPPEAIEDAVEHLNRYHMLNRRNV